MLSHNKVFDAFFLPQDGYNQRGKQNKTIIEELALYGRQQGYRIFLEANLDQVAWREIVDASLVAVVFITRAYVNNIFAHPQGKQALALVETISRKAPDFLVVVVLESGMVNTLNWSIEPFKKILRCERVLMIEDGLSALGRDMNLLFKTLESCTEKLKVVLKKESQISNQRLQYMAEGVQRMCGFNKGINLAESFQSFQKALELGHPAAAVFLARFYFMGMGAPKDQHKSEELVSKAIELGVLAVEESDADEYTLWALGLLHWMGLVVPANRTKSRHFYELSASKGFAPAQNNLAILYLNDNDPSLVDSSGQSLAWFWKAAEQGYADAQYNLATFYQNGRYVLQNLDLAAELFQKSAIQGDRDAQFKFGLIRISEEQSLIPRNEMDCVRQIEMSRDQGNTVAESWLRIHLI